MAVLSDATIARLRLLPVKLAFPDTCELQRTVSGGTDSMGNTLPASDAIVELAPCALRAGGLQPTEQIIADKLGWIAPYAIELPYSTLATPEDTIRVNGRTFHIGGVVTEGKWGITATAICEERG